MNRDLPSSFILNHKKRKAKETQSNCQSENAFGTQLLSLRVNGRIKWIFSPFTETPMSESEGSACQMLLPPRSAEGSDWFMCFAPPPEADELIDRIPALRLFRQERTVPFRYHIPPKLTQHSLSSRSTSVLVTASPSSCVRRVWITFRLTR